MSELPDRYESMVRRVLREARACGVQGAERLEAAQRLAMELRAEALTDDHDPAALHPGRNALVLLLDVEERDVTTLAAASVLDLDRPELAPPRGDVERVLGPAVAELVRAVPAPDEPSFVERLVARPALRRIVLVDRLDAIRHVHLTCAPHDQRARLDRVREVYLPLAARTHPTLVRRFRSWSRHAARRLDRG